jgi:hypothetical protein
VILIVCRSCRSLEATGLRERALDTVTKAFCCQTDELTRPVALGCLLSRCVTWQRKRQKTMVSGYSRRQ